MFKRIIHEDWTQVIPMIAFGILFTIFIVATVRALRIKPAERERLATLPLDDPER